MERERSRKSRSSVLNSGTAYFKILMRKGKVQVFRIRCIMLILEIINSIEPLVFSSNVVKEKYCERIRII